MVKLKDKDFTILISHEDILNRIKELAKQINNDYRDKRPLFIAILNGSFMFASDLMKHIETNCEITFIKIASYQAMHSTGKVTELLGLKEDVSQRHVVILEDIVDTGITIEQVSRNMHEKKPLSLQVATLLFKPEALQREISLQYVGFKISNKFVVGYGLDYDGLGRNLKDLYVLKEEDGQTSLT